MEIKDTEQLEAFFELLVTNGVEEFEGFGFHVRFTEAMFSKDKMIPQPAEQEAVQFAERELTNPESIWEVPELWPGGKPPSFPTK